MYYHRKYATTTITHKKFFQTQFHKCIHDNLISVLQSHVYYISTSITSINVNYVRPGYDTVIAVIYHIDLHYRLDFEVLILLSDVKVNF